MIVERTFIIFYDKLLRKILTILQLLKLNFYQQYHNSYRTEIAIQYNANVFVPRITRSLKN